MLLVATMSLGQLCYNPDEDINAHNFMEKAVLLEKPLSLSIKSKDHTCIELKNQKELSEAKFLVSMDSTKKALTLN